MRLTTVVAGFNPDPGTVAATSEGMDKTPLQVVNETIEAIESLDKDGNGFTGRAVKDGQVVEDARGIAPASIGWTADRGLWAWDGALIAFKAVGIDVDAPLVE